jgi:polyhydroxyalkanoate synthase
MTEPGGWGPFGRIWRGVEQVALSGRNGIRIAAGIQHTEVGLSDKDVVWSHGRTELWHYRSEQVRFARPLLIIYSLFNRSYILDLRPGNSVVERLLAAGFDVYLLDWGVPDERDAANRIEDYVDSYMPMAIEQTCRLSGSDGVNLFGYCMGGVLSVLHAAHHPDSPLRSLTALATPADLQQLGPMSHILAHSELEAWLDDIGMVPPAVILGGFRALAPVGEITSRLNLVERLWSNDYVTAYQAMTAWATDQVPLPGGVARQLRQMVLDNALVNDRVTLGDEPVHLADITVPFLHVLAKRDHIVPESAAAPLIGLVGSEDKTELRLDAGHVGLMVGRTAARTTLPTIIDFLSTRWEGAS